MIEATLAKLAEGCSLTAEQMQQTIEAVLRGECTEVEIAALLTALRVKGESVDEVVGAARALRAHVTPIRCSRAGLVDTCGTGGDGSGTFNISTATALVVAAAGVRVAKHGNRGISSASGSADALRELGVNIEAPVPVVERCLTELGIGFCYAPRLHGAMQHVAAVRRALRFRTLFNLLGPLTNPAGAEFQLVGASQERVAEKLAAALGQLGCRHALVVCGVDGFDEVSISGPTRVWEVHDAANANLRTFEWNPRDFGLPRWDRKELVVNSATESAETIRRIFSGQRGAARDIVLANAAAAFFMVDRVHDLLHGVTLAAETIDGGAVVELLEKLITLTRVGAGEETGPGVAPSTV